MAYYIDYAKLPPHTARAKAFADAKEFMGKAYFRKVKATLSQQYFSQHLVTTFSMMSGIEGYPARVVVEELCFPGEPPIGA